MHTGLLAWLFVLLALTGLAVVRLATQTVDTDLAGGHSLARALGYGVPQRVLLGYNPNAPSQAASSVTAVPPPPLVEPMDVAASELPPASAAPAQGAGQRFRVANTDGLGVVLRTAPRQDARVPRGLLEGMSVTLLERSSDQWARVRADSGLEGWVPLQYLAPTS